MTWKLSILVLCVTVVVHITAIEPDYGPVAYEFHYEVHDPHTGDIKSQKESRKDDKVEGQYELIEPDGHRRLVQYKADDHHGFEAIVHREPTNIKIPQPDSHHKVVHAKILTHAPLVHYSHASHAEHDSHASHAEHPHYENHVSFSGPNSQYKY